MLLIIYFILIITSTIILYLSTTPIILGINILSMALLLSVTLASSIRSWYAFLVFLIYIGGILVIFAYFLALSPNQQIPTTSNIIYIVLTLLTLVVVAIVTDTKVFIAQETFQDRIYLYSVGTAPILILLAVILLLTIIIVVKLTNRSSGPLRPFSYV